MNSYTQERNIEKVEASKQALAKLPVEFKKYSFLSKCRYCSCESTLLFKRWVETGDVFDDKKPYPWELSVFTMLAMLDGEYQNNVLYPKDASRLLAILRDNQYYDCNVENVDRLFSHNIATVQSRYQMNILLLRERYTYFFRFVNSALNFPKIIKKKLGVSSDVIIEMLLLVICAATVGESFEKVLKDFTLYANTLPTNDFLNLLEQLSFTRSEYSKLQIVKIKTENNSGRGCVSVANLLEERPFIIEGDITYLTNVYLGVFALTDCMLHRLTKEDNSLRSLIGKELIETYVVNIIEKSRIYSDVKREVPYSSGGKESLSPDVCIEHNGKVLFLELKLCQPRLALRNLAKEEHEKLLARYVEYLDKFIKHISERDKYLSVQYDKENTYGLLVVYEDSFIFRYQIFDKLRGVLDKEEIDFGWVRSHIHIVGLYEIEKFAYGRKDIFPFLEGWVKDKKKWDDYCIPCVEGFDFKYPDYEELLKNPNKAFAHLFVGTQKS